MGKKYTKTVRAEKRRMRVRRKIFGTSERPRFTVHKSLNNTFAQIVDDEKMITLAAASTLSKDLSEKVAGKNRTEAAGLVGEEIARKAIDKGIKKVAFDRNRYVYHGRVRQLAEAARKTGLEF
jgi:large subunit ribosomal protein L18